MRKKAEGWIWRRRRNASAGASTAAARVRKRSAIENIRIRNRNRKTSLAVETVSVEQVQAWCAPDEAASDVVDVFDAWRRRRNRRNVGDSRHPPLLSIPPFNRVALRPGHVLEITGPSGSGKTELLLQAAVSCILPTKFKGISYGGSQAVVLMFDLDGRFDMPRLVYLLQARIDEAHSKGTGDATPASLEEQKHAVFSTSLKRFYRLLCFKNFEFLSALKTFHVQANKIAQEHHGIQVQLVLIDGIGAYYWLDWMSSCAAAYTNKRRPEILRTHRS